MTTPKTLYFYLTYAGALPFIGCALLLAFNYPTLPLLGNVTQIIQIYAVVIAAFMAGVHWGQYLALKGNCPINLLFTSNGVAIAVWLSYLLLSFGWFMANLLLLFLLLLWIDYRLFQQQKIEATYFETRCIVTGIVSLALLVAGVYG